MPKKCLCLGLPVLNHSVLTRSHHLDGTKICYDGLTFVDFEVSDKPVTPGELGFSGDVGMYM